MSYTYNLCCMKDDNTAQYRHVTKKKINAHDGPVTNIKWHHKVIFLFIVMFLRLQL